MNPLQTFLLAALDKILASLPAIIAAIGAAWFARKSINKKTEEKANETNQIVQQNTNEQNKILDNVHVAVNGNLTAEKARADLAEQRIRELEAQLKRRSAKRRSDP